MTESLLTRFEGWFYLLVGGAICAALFFPLGNSLLSEKVQISNIQTQIESHVAQLSEPVPVNAYSRFSSFVYAPAEGEATRLASGDIQSALIDNVRASQARLVDLRPVEGAEMDTLEALQFRLETEGDIQALLDVIRSLGTLGYPVLIDTLTLKPVGQFDRPDRRLRLSMDISIWAEAETT